MRIDEFVNRLEGVKQCGENFAACCPAHDDQRASLSVSAGDDGRILLKCHAGCDSKDVVTEMGLKLSDLFPSENGQSQRHIVATYDYRDENGELLYQVVRYHPKDFRQRRPGKDGQWIWNMTGVRRILYRLPELLKAPKNATVYIAEGEKDVDRLFRGGVVATCNVGGAGKWRKEYARYLTHRDVVILPHHDKPGMEHARKIAKTIGKVAASVKIVELPGLEDKQDISDWLDAGNTVDDLLSICQEAADIEMCKSKREFDRNLPTVMLPGSDSRIIDTAKELGRLVATVKRYFSRGENIVTISQDDHGQWQLQSVKSQSLPSIFETVANLVQMTPDGEEAPAVCSRHMGELIAYARDFHESLPPIRTVTNCPVLIELDGKLITIEGYDQRSGILAGGSSVTDIAIDEATDLLVKLLSDFRFATAGDKSRAIASMITPALAFGGLLGARAPIDLGEANESQTGKGYRNKITCAIYNVVPSIVTQRRSGVGSLEESFNAALIRGASFIAIDNVRGQIDSPSLESFLTEDDYNARSAYMRNTKVDPRRIVVMITSNRAELTTDLSNRSACVRLLKQPDQYEFRRHTEGDILDHIKVKQPTYLGAVFSVVRRWHEEGKPQTTETRHDFRTWARRLDWIVQNIFGQAPLLDGHRDAQARIANPHLSWLRDIALVVEKSDLSDRWLRAHDILDALDRCGRLDLAELSDDEDVEDEDARNKALRRVGRKLSKCLVDDQADVDGIHVVRGEIDDDQFRSRHVYRFSRTPQCPEYPQ